MSGKDATLAKLLATLALCGSTLQACSLDATGNATPAAPEAGADSSIGQDVLPAQDVLQEAQDSSSQEVGSDTDSLPDTPGDESVGDAAPEAEAGTEAGMDAEAGLEAESGVDVLQEADTGLEAEVGVEAEAGLLAGDQCPGLPLALTGTGPAPRVGKVNATTVGMSHGSNGAGLCSPASGVDAVYSFTSDVSGKAKLTLTTSNYDALLYVRSDCSQEGTHLACSDAAGANGVETLEFGATEQTTYYVFVDSAHSVSGTFQLDIVVTPGAPADVCPGEAVAWTGSGLQDRTATVQGSTAGKANDDSTACGSTAPDAIYSFTADTEGILLLDLLSQTWDSTLAVRTHCSTASTQLVCKKTAGAGAHEVAELWAQSGTTYYVFVDGLYSSSSGDFTLNATLSPSKPAETCPGETAVWVGTGNSPRTFSAQDDTSHHWYNTSGSCSSSYTRDTVYALTPDVDGVLELDATGTGWDIAMFVRTDCAAPSSEVVCKDSEGSGQKETYSFWAKQGTTYYVFLAGGTPSAQGLYSFNAKLTPLAPQEKCPGASVTWQGSGTQDRTASLTGNTGLGWNDDTGSCGATGSSDSVYAFVADTDGLLRLELQPQSWDGVLYVRTDCATPSTELLCEDHGGNSVSEKAELWATQGTTYYAFVEGAQNNAKGYFLLNATLIPRKPNEECPGLAASWTAGTNDQRLFSAGDDTTNHVNNSFGTCGSQTSRDVVYALTPDVDGVLTVEVQGTNWDTAMYVRTDCLLPASEIGCKYSAPSGQKETLSFWATQGSTYYVFLTSAQSAEPGGFYSFQATLTPQQPEDKCPGKDIVLAGSPLEATVSGNTSLLWGDYQGTCNPSNTNDAVYRLVAPQAGTLTITVAPTAFDVSLYVRSGGCTGSEVGCRNMNWSGGSETLTVTTVQGEEYYIFVDTQGTITGSYALSLKY